MTKSLNISIIYGMLLIFLAACSTVKNSAGDTAPVKDAGFSEFSRPAETILSGLPDYTDKLQSVRGKGKAIVSEPGNTERITVLFSSNRERSLVTVKNSIGIEGGKMLTDGDTLLIYNKVDKYARKIDIRKGDLSRIDHLASLNILDILNFTVEPDEVEKVLQNENYFLLRLGSGTKIYVNRNTGRISRVVQPKGSPMPYSEINYEAYSDLEGFMLPRRITIFGDDRMSKVHLLVQSLDVNPKLEDLTITLPDHITVYYR